MPAFAKDCRIGSRVLLQNGVVVGSDGFGFARQPDGRWYKMRQSGITVIGDDVEIQAHSAIDRATVGETHIGRGTKIDNLVQVGHACKVGEDTLLCGQVGLGGNHRSGQSLHPGGTSRRGGPPDDRRRRHRLGPERRSRRRAGRGHLLRLSRDGQSGVAKIRGRFQPAAGTAARTPRIARRKSPASEEKRAPRH